MKNKKGFTLVELLAVIVILAVILVIAIPRILDVIESSKLNSFESSARLIISDAEKQYAINKVNGSEDAITCENTSKLNSSEYSSCEITFDSEGIASINLVGSGKFEGLTCTGNSTSLTCGTVTDEACFTFNSGTGAITGYSSTCEKDVKIPSTIGGVAVTSIGYRAFSNNNLTSVTIPNSVISIGDDAFRGNRLTSVTIPSSVTSIESYAFEYNNLTSVTIPNSVTSIGQWAFYKNSLTSIVIPNSVTSIENGAFNDNQLPDNKAFIYKRKSDGSENVKTIVSYGGAKRDNVVIPNSVTSIESYAFYNNNLTSVTIPNSVTSIKFYAFNNNNLTSVTIPNSVTSIENGAFSKTTTSNSNLTSIINKTGRSFDWGKIISNSTGYNFVTGTVENSVGNVSVTSE